MFIVACNAIHMRGYSSVHAANRAPLLPLAGWHQRMPTCSQKLRALAVL